MKLKQTGKLAPKNKPHQLIRDAVTDLKKQEKCKRVVICMYDWHAGGYENSDGTKVCYQCFAGSTMSRRCNLDLNDNLDPHDMPAAVRSKLRFLNHIREGSLQNAFDTIGYEVPESLCTLETQYGAQLSGVPEYVASDPAPFHEAMLRIADQIETAIKVDGLTRAA